jgi:hypothetical protein
VLNRKIKNKVYSTRLIGPRSQNSAELNGTLEPCDPSHLETAVNVQEVRKLDAYLKRVFGNPRIRVVPRPKKDDSAEVYIGEEFIGVLFVDDEDDDRSFQFQMAILEEDLADVG